MILIADSGSTKTEFRLIGDKGEETIKESFALPGINPFYQTEEEIKELIYRFLYPHVSHYHFHKIYFYGAGCAFPDKKRMVENALLFSFPQAGISIASDLLAAARALFGEGRGVACILGTGSNSCLYDGKTIVQNVSPLGFILGDEGSGAVLGRKFVSDCLKNQLPLFLRDRFLSQYQTTPEEIMEKVYKQPFPNRYLASFTPFLLENMKEEYIYKIVKESFTDFFVRNIRQYPVTDEKLGFVGSVAFNFQDILKETAVEQGFQIEKICQTPIDGLVQFHWNLQNNFWNV